MTWVALWEVKKVGGVPQRHSVKGVSSLVPAMAGAERFTVDPAGQTRS